MQRQTLGYASPSEKRPAKTMLSGLALAFSSPGLVLQFGFWTSRFEMSLGAGVLALFVAIILAFGGLAIVLSPGARWGHLQVAAILACLISLFGCLVIVADMIFELNRISS